jgi:hypothetical protein
MSTESRLCPACWTAELMPEDGTGLVECTNGCTVDVIAGALLKAVPHASAAQLVARKASDIPVERVRFLVPERVPLGAVTLLAGDPGLGKSTLTALWAADVTTGAYGDEPAAVLIANAEDAAGAVTVPRLAAAGADLERVELFVIAEDGQERTFTIPDDVPRLEEHAEKVGARLVIVDPLAAHLSDGTNTHRDHSTRRAMAPLVAMAERLGCAVVVVSHLNKATGLDALYRVGGTIGMTGGPRSVLLFARDPDDPEGEQGSRRALAHIKGNWAKLAPTVVYEHEPFDYAASEGLTVQTHRLALLGESEADSTALLSPNRDDPPASQRERAGELLADALGDGNWHRAKEIQQAAKTAGVKLRTLDRACSDIGVERDRRGFPAVAFWRLPEAQPEFRFSTLATTDGDTDSPSGVATLEIARSNGDPEAQPAQSRQSRGNGDTGRCGSCGGLQTKVADTLVCFACTDSEGGS